MATFVAFDMNASSSDRLNALFKAAHKPSVYISAPHLPTPNLSRVLSLKANLSGAPSITIKEIPASSGWSISSAGSTRPSSIMEKRNGRKGLRSMFTRNKMGTQSSHNQPEIIIEEGIIAPMPSAEDLHRALELTARELQDDVSKSSTEPVTTPISMNPFLTYIDTSPTETESQSISDSLEKNMALAMASDTPASDSLNIHSIISKAKRMSITSIQGARPSTATSTMSSPSTPRQTTQAPPTKKRSSIFPQRGSRSGSSISSNPSTKSSDTITDGQAFVKALKEAKKHSTLSTPKLPAESIITMSQWKEGEVLALGSSKSEKAKLKMKKQIVDVIKKSGWTSKIYVLTAGGLASPPYVLQFAPTGAASRSAERTLQLTKQSRAFVTDAIPGRHWVLQISQLLDTIAATETKKPVSRMSIKASGKVQGLASLLLVLESGDDMEEWLTALRHEIDVLGGKGRHVEAVAEVPTEVVEVALKQEVKPQYPTSSLSHAPSFTRRERPTSESDRGSWSEASQRQSAAYSYRPSIDAASSTLSSVEDRKLESLRNSGHSRMTTDNAPPTPASSTHSPAQSFSNSPAKNHFFYDETPSETDEDKAARAGYEYKATRQPPSIPTEPSVLRANAKARRSFQMPPSSPLVSEITPPGTALGQETTTEAAPQRKRSLRGPPPTAFENGAHLSIVPDQPSPASFQNDPLSEVNPFQLDSAEEEERKDTFPCVAQAVPEIPIPPRSNKRQSLQAPMKLGFVPEVAALYVPSPQPSPVRTTPSVFEKRMSRAGSGGSEIKIQFWGASQPATQPSTQPPSQSHSRTVSEEERDIERMDELTAMVTPRSIQEQMRALKPNRSRQSLGRSDPFDLETHLAAVSPHLTPSDDDRYSFGTDASMYSDDSFAEFADGESETHLGPTMVPLPLSPLITPDLSSPIGRANAKALSLRAERVAKRDSWGMAPQRPESIHKPSFRRGSRTGPAFGGRSPPKPLSARGFLNLAAAAPAEEVLQMMGSPQGMTRLKRSASDVANEAPKEYTRPANYRASTVPSMPFHIGAMLATPAHMARKNSLLRRSPVLSSTTEHPAQYTRASARNMVPAVGPMQPPPSTALPNVPGRMGSVSSSHTHRSQRSGGTESSLSIRYEDDTGRRW